MKWISINERLPEIDLPVLIAYKDWDRINICVARRGESDYWNVQGVGGYEIENDFQKTDITHWMPLPQFPGDTS